MLCVKTLRCASNTSNGPAAKANWYVLIGSVSLKTCHIIPAGGDCGSPPLVSSNSGSAAPSVFEMTFQFCGAVNLSVKRAFRSGWSKQGNAVLASEGTKSV